MANDLVLLDCDDVLLDYLPGIMAFARKKGLDPNPDGPGQYDITQWLGITPDASRTLIREFNEGVETGFGDLPAIPGAIEGVATLRRAGYRLRIISSFSDKPASIRVREDNLARVFGEGAFEGMDVLALGSRKKEALARHPRSHFVDDLVKHAIDAAELGHTSFLMRAHHNAADFAHEAMPSVSRVQDWPHLVTLLDAAPVAVPGLPD